MAQYVYTMRRVGKVVPPKRQILKNISLNFFPGAKIGVLGLNGSGKSTLRRIMAGEEKNFEGEVVPMPKMKIGFLPQHPQLDPEKTVREAAKEGLGEMLVPAWEQKIAPLSGGEKRRVALCWVLLSKPEILLLDAPTNNLDA